jgi:hypothetical protein
MPKTLTRPRYKSPVSKPAPARPALTAVPSFQCACGTLHHAADGKLPVGWTQSAGAVFCLDCTRIGIPLREMKPRQPDARSDKVRLRGEVMELLVEGANLMPPGAAVRVAWVQRVNALLADVRQSAA